MAINQVIQSGAITKDVELMSTSTGVKVAKVSYAVIIGFDKETKEPQSQFFTATAFGDRAERLASRGKKGMFIIVQGKLNRNEFTDKAGIKRNDMQIIIDNFETYHSKKTLMAEGNETEYKAYRENNSPQKKVEQAIESVEADDELPF
jgi:single-strand DNA-binding protein